LLQARRYEFDVERAIYLTVLHRLFASAAAIEPLKVGSEDYLIPATEALNLASPLPSDGVFGPGARTKGPKDLGYTALCEGFA
jgi:hypothetical protein